MDEISKKRIALLHPKVREEVTKLIEECNKALTGKAQVRVTQTLRTKEEQDALYAQGRTKPGKKVTNAQGLSSIHNFGLAFDFVLIIDGKEASWDVEKDWDKDGVSDWREVAAIFIKHGWEWGGNWKSFVDYPHFQKTFGYTTAQLRAKYLKKDFIKGTTYVNI